MNLDDELRALGRSAVVPPVDDALTAAVLNRVADIPVRRRMRDRWRFFVAGLCVLLAGLALTPPVRATVAEWLRIGGVEARPVGTAPSTAPPIPVVTGRLSLDDAARTAGFTPAWPRELGTPAGVDASPRFVAMGWDGVRLEQFQSGVSPLYWKKYYNQIEYVPEVSGYWFSTPHTLVLVDQRVVRIAGPTLVWERAGVTYRLEVADKARAVQLAAGTS
ncbi:hypothetical protein HPO96_35885 [Kribbella sandramycini]|uniref:Uncharacterized protein n=1 Tax=Kribbella sandramycini TaxID=60450 RepID=A0A7Y4L783_9ACTN|nr:hypothetical protein [Kribbella sandramycini]MBB6568869.1 hypothetical protein [Kribbella sandramycini]NOL45637.1 hypothetical protein [Kribbella sandramycini]